MRRTKSAGGVVLNSKGQVLVVSQHGNSWSLPKGHIDPDEDAKTAAAREIEEESGVKKLHYIKDLGSYERYRIGKDGGEEKNEWKHIIIFLYTTPETELNPTDPDNPEARWVEADQVSGLLTHPADKVFFENALSEIKGYIS